MDGKGNGHSLSLPISHAGGVGPYTTLRFKRSASPGPLFRVGRNRSIFSVRTLLESGHADHSVDRDTDVGTRPTGQRPGGIVHLLDPWTGGKAGGAAQPIGLERGPTRGWDHQAVLRPPVGARP